MGRVLVTGANGFVGRALCPHLEKQGWEVVKATRQSMEGAVAVGEIGPETDWGQALENVDAVVHLAARVHVMNDTVADPLEAFRQVNTRGTKHLAQSAAKAGVKRLVFLSSIKVNGEETFGHPFDEAMWANPLDAYGQSKWEAEQALWEVVESTTLQGVVIRPPLVYGPGVKGNFETLLRIAHKGIPLPFAAVKNARSLVYVGNLVGGISKALEGEAASGQTFMISDGEDLSTAELIDRSAKALGHKSKLFPFPIFLLKLAGILTGKSAMIARLTGSLQVNSAKIRDLLQWQPPFSVEKGLKETADWFITHNKSG
ncbi:MAG: SDR family oxidoreductase [Rhodospirillales bacterium]|nr:SDR family oxidoreductase [Rhodospirillales bacterium]